MDQTNNGQPQRHMKSFWPLFIIFLVAAVAAGFVYFFEFNLKTDYDLQSMELTVHRRTEQTTTSTKKLPKSSTTTTQTK